MANVDADMKANAVCVALAIGAQAMSLEPRLLRGRCSVRSTAATMPGKLLGTRREERARSVYGVGGVDVERGRGVRGSRAGAPVVDVATSPSSRT